MQLQLSKTELDSAVQVYLEALGFGRNDFTITTKLVAGRSGNDGKVEVTLLPKMEPSLEKVTTEVEPKAELQDYAEVHGALEEDTTDDIVEEEPAIEDGEIIEEGEVVEEAPNDGYKAESVPVINPIDEDDDEEF